MRTDQDIGYPRGFAAVPGMGGDVYGEPEAAGNRCDIGDLRRLHAGRRER
ncbi:hypothetical protein MSAS_17550 [Mycobacterium saskatchewanense]|nr:hypothetical protein MSAS_17550 [Mycobacterium saskatchewanense]